MQKSRNCDSIVAVESRLDLDHGITGHVASDQNFVDLGSTEHSVENREMRNRESAFCIRLWSQPLDTSARDGGKR
jgi:hypothetical protein